MSGVIHDWDDEQAIRILDNCRRAMAPNGKVLVVEMLLPSRGEPRFAALFDLNMLVMNGGANERKRISDICSTRPALRLRGSSRRSRPMGDRGCAKRGSSPVPLTSRTGAISRVPMERGQPPRALRLISSHLQIVTTLEVECS
jgi:O-methyltransferase